MIIEIDQELRCASDAVVGAEGGGWEDIVEESKGLPGWDFKGTDECF